MNSKIKTAITITAGLLMLGAVACQSVPASPAPGDLPNESISQTLPSEPINPPIVETLPVAPALPPVNVGNSGDATEAVENTTVTGSLTYLEEITLSAEAITEIKLIDISRADAPAITLGEQIVEGPMPLPLSFDIEYDPADIDERFSYAVSARIEDQGKLMFINTTRYGVLTYGQPNHVDMVLQMINRPLPPTNVDNTVDNDEAAENAIVTGSVAYRERIALSPDAVIEIKLIDVSRADAPAITLGEQIIEGPVQVPVKFEIEYNPADIDDRFSYAISARITDQGRLMFINTSRYAVLTRDNPAHVDMVLQMVASPEPKPVPPATEPQELPEKVEAPAPIEKAEVANTDNNEYILNLVTGLPGGCAEFNDAEMTRNGNEINVTVTNLVPGPEVMMPCTAIYGYHESSVNLGSDFNAGETYNVIVNGELAASFEAQAPDAPMMARNLSPIEKIEVTEAENNEYILTVVSRLPLGSSCSKFDGYTVSHRGGTYIEVEVTHLEVIPSDGPMICTADLPVVMTEISLGSEFEAGETYTVKVNGEHIETFTAS